MQCHQPKMFYVVLFLLIVSALAFRINLKFQAGKVNSLYEELSVKSVILCIARREIEFLGWVYSSHL
jgi:hypothetical protein